MEKHELKNGIWTHKPARYCAFLWSSMTERKTKQIELKDGQVNWLVEARATWLHYVVVFLTSPLQRFRQCSLAHGLLLRKPAVIWLILTWHRGSTSCNWCSFVFFVSNTRLTKVTTRQRNVIQPHLCFVWIPEFGYILFPSEHVKTKEINVKVLRSGRS